jgi:putative transposase
VAKEPRQVWLTNISYLPGPIKGLFYYLHFIMDLYSRKIVGYEVHENESSENLATVLKRATLNEGSFAPITRHLDNGSPMKGTTLVARCYLLGIASSYSRPRTSNDNADTESMFRTVKYCVSYPYDGFESLLVARVWIEGFVQFYNEEHHHSGLNFVTPNQKHNGEDGAILANRVRVYEEAKAKNPKRWFKGNTRNWEPVASTSLVPTNPDTPEPTSTTTQPDSNLTSAP